MTMSSEKILLSDKYKAFLRHRAPVEFLEGTTLAGKTTVGVLKFMFCVAESEKKQHIISGLDLGTVEKNIITKDLGLQDNFGKLVEYSPGGKGEHSLPHILFHTDNGDKVIYVLGYDNKTRWKKALGGQYGCLYIDEINIADIAYVQEASMRCDYLIATLNPDDPGLPIYDQYINHARPLPEWESETPAEIREELSQEPKPGWVHWFFSFKDNPGIEKEKIEIAKTNTPYGSKQWKNKIEGLRGRATGLIFSNFDRKKHVVSAEWVKRQVRDGKMTFVQFSAGLDTAYSQKSQDTISLIFQGITKERQLIILDERIYQNRDLENPLAPSDTVVNLIDFLERNRKEWGFSKNVFVDSADQATMTEAKKYKRLYGSVYNFVNAYKKMQIIDRINLQIGWLQQGKYLVVDSCRGHITELERYSWLGDKDNTPEDANDHTINASQYGWIPYKGAIGYEEDERK